MRKKAVNDFQKDFYKLMNNAIFGKILKKSILQLILISNYLRKNYGVDAKTHENGIGFISTENAEIDKQTYI